MAKVWYAHVTESHICFSQRLGEEKQEAHREGSVTLEGSSQVNVLITHSHVESPKLALSQDTYQAWSCDSFG